MRVYLADQYRNKEFVKQRRTELESTGDIEVCSRWLEEKYSANATLKDLGNEQQIYANIDIADIGDCDVFVLFTVDPSIPTLRGGRHFETGYAYGQGKPVLIVGPKENIFHYLGGVRSVDTWEAAQELLLKVAKMIPASSDMTYFQRVPLKNLLKFTPLALESTPIGIGN
jgi:hypothetical protein